MTTRESRKLKDVVIGDCIARPSWFLKEQSELIRVFAVAASASLNGAVASSIRSNTFFWWKFSNCSDHNTCSNIIQRHLTMYIVNG